jgi:hypothetical protein
VEHRAITNFRQRTLLFTICFASFQDTVCSYSSAKTVLLQATLGLPFLRFLCGFQSTPCLVMLFWSFLKVCPIYFNFLILISLLIGICCVVSHNLLLLTVFGHHILNMLRRHRLTKVCSLLMVSCFVFQVSHTHNIAFKYFKFCSLMNLVWCPYRPKLSKGSYSFIYSFVTNGLINL